jgi:hypothetical protein
VLNEFSKDKNRKCGVRSQCKICIKQYLQENNEHEKQRQKKWREKNKERIKRKDKKYREENKERRKLYFKKYYEQNKERIKPKHKKYREENRDHRNQHGKKYQKKRYRNDPIYKLKRNVRSAIYRYLESSKSKRTAEILGCSYEQFYLNLGAPPEDAHLDHIIPQSLANTEEEIYILNHWSNFQWLSDYENMSKGNRYTRHHKYQHVLRNHPEPDKIRGIVNRAQQEDFQIIKEPTTA